MNDANQKIAEIGQRAFDEFKNAIEKGAFEDFIEMTLENVSFYAALPFEEWRGEQRGRERLRELLRFERDEMELRVKFTQISMTAMNDLAAFGFSVEGSNKGGAFRNRLALFFVIENDKIAEFREYAGDIDPSAVAAINHGNSGK